MAAARRTCLMTRSLVPRPLRAAHSTCVRRPRWRARVCCSRRRRRWPSSQPRSQAKVPVADFFRTPRLDRPALSPGGRYLAGAVAVDGGRVQLAVFDLENPGQSKVVAGFLDADVNGLWWVNDERIVFDAIDRDSSKIIGPHRAGVVGGQPRRQRLPPADQRLAELWRDVQECEFPCRSQAAFGMAAAQRACGRLERCAGAGSSRRPARRRPSASSWHGSTRRPA